VSIKKRTVTSQQEINQKPMKNSANGVIKAKFFSMYRKKKNPSQPISNSGDRNTSLNNDNI